MAPTGSTATEGFWIEDEGVLVTQVVGREGGEPDPVDQEQAPGSVVARPLADGEVPAFRFARLGPRSGPLNAALTGRLAQAMVGGRAGPTGGVPAGYTYLGQFIDHDLTLDRTRVMLGEEVSPADLVQGRSQPRPQRCAAHRHPAHRSAPVPPAQHLRRSRRHPAPVATSRSATSPGCRWSTWPRVSGWSNGCASGGWRSRR